MKRQSFVYIIGNNRPTLYIGVTSDLVKRIYEHKQKLIEGFTKKYQLCKLFYYEIFNDIAEAIKREKQLKNWHREWKLNLIKTKTRPLKICIQKLLDPETCLAARRANSG